jgi:choline dehydrogenase
VLPYFKSCEDQQRGASAYHGVGGPVSVSDLPSKHLLGEAFHAASEKLGVPRNDDFNGARQLGTGYVQTTTRKGRRWSSARGYLRGAALQNIDIRLNAMVERVVLTGKRATGVAWTELGGRREATAGCEVILCGGTFNSPQLLQLSGIGPAPLLSAHGIDVLHDLPGVGENLRDHFGIGAQFRSKSRTTVNDLYNSKLRGGLALLRWILFRTGPFADNGNYSNTFVCSGPDIDRPDMMITFMAWCTDDTLKPYRFPGFTILAEHMRSRSIGHVRIKGPRPTDPPAIQFNFLADEADRHAALAGLKFARRIAQTDPMAGFVDTEIAPGKDLQTDSELMDYCRAEGLSLLHPVGTCKMGVGDTAVVDPRLRVRGIEGLRVIDASIMPTIVTGNTNAAAIMIGEKGASMILEDTRAEGRVQ